MSDRQTFLKDKPYQFIPLLEQCQKIKHNSHNKIEKNSYHGKLKLKITTLTPLHIGGTQQDYDNQGNVIKKQIYRNGKIIIPGSSLKGEVKTIAEAISYSCAVKVPDKELEVLLPLRNRQSCSDIKDGLCIICSIFGMTSRKNSYKGKVSFGEFTLKTKTPIDKAIIFKKIPKLESPFKNYPQTHDSFQKPECNFGNERLYYCKACNTGNCQNCKKQDFFQAIQIAGPNREKKFRGRKFYRTDNTKEETIPQKETCYEMIKPGSILEGEILFENLREEEGKLLSYALGIHNFFTPKLGYGKPLGYGNIKIELKSVENMETPYSSEKKITKEIFEQWGQEYRTNSPAEIRERIDELEKIMKVIQ